MHQNRSPRPPSWIKGSLLLREGDMEREGKGRKGRGRQWRGGEGMGGEGTGREGTPNILLHPSSSFLEICLAGSQWEMAFSGIRTP